MVESSSLDPPHHFHPRRAAYCETLTNHHILSEVTCFPSQSCRRTITTNTCLFAFSIKYVGVLRGGVINVTDAYREVSVRTQSKIELLFNHNLTLRDSQDQRVTMLFFSQYFYDIWTLYLASDSISPLFSLTVVI